MHTDYITHEYSNLAFIIMIIIDILFTLKIMCAKWATCCNPFMYTGVFGSNTLSMRGLLSLENMFGGMVSASISQASGRRFNARPVYFYVNFLTNY